MQLNAYYVFVEESTLISNGEGCGKKHTQSIPIFLWIESGRIQRRENEKPRWSDMQGTSALLSVHVKFYPWKSGLRDCIQIRFFFCIRCKLLQFRCSSGLCLDWLIFCFIIISNKGLLGHSQNRPNRNIHRNFFPNHGIFDLGLPKTFH
jgi:hypothetical protein